MKYVAEELEAISFDILQQFAPALLEEQGFECKEQIELNWACRQFAYHCTGIEIDLQSLTDWIPDIRHAAVHRHQMTALAACKTIHEAANLAVSLGSKEVGDKLQAIALEMDWARCEMIKHGALNDKQLPADVKQAVVDRLRGAITAAKDNVGRDQSNEWRLSDDVTSYTMDEKLMENPWANPKQLFRVVTDTIVISTSRPTTRQLAIKERQCIAVHIPTEILEYPPLSLHIPQVSSLRPSRQTPRRLDSRSESLEFLTEATVC